MGVTLSSFPMEEDCRSNNFEVRNKFCTYHFVSSHVCIAIHFVLIELSRKSLLLSDDPSKRGDVKTLARSLVFLPPQVKMTLKLTASR